MPIVDLRQMNSRQLEPLLEEEARHWRDELHWDYRVSLELIKKFLDARSLAGCVAVENGQPAGYGFYVLEEHKGLVGGLFVSPRFPQLAISQKLLGEMLSTLRAVPRIERIEAQLMPFGCALDRVLIEQDFRLYTRQFMLLALAETQAVGAPISAGLRLERWNDHCFEPCARLIHLAYANHVDGEINDQYRSESGALKFLKNIIILPGCGRFQPEASFVLRSLASDQLVGMVLTSAVSEGVGHTTQICVMPGYQGQALGRQLMEASIQALRSRRFTALSLTVTSVNAPAVRLYDKLGFRTIKTFPAGVWRT
jgi:ribosomal protein S18 acetylase RimI-like enzyme